MRIDHLKAQIFPKDLENSDFFRKIFRRDNKKSFNSTQSLETLKNNFPKDFQVKKNAFKCQTFFFGKMLQMSLKTWICLYDERPFKASFLRETVHHKRKVCRKPLKPVFFFFFGQQTFPRIFSCLIFNTYFLRTLKTRYFQERNFPKGFQKLDIVEMFSQTIFQNLDFFFKKKFRRTLKTWIIWRTNYSRNLQLVAFVRQIFQKHLKRDI